MKKLGLLVKSTSAGIIRENIERSSSYFIIGFSGLSSLDMSMLRKSLRGIDAEFLVARNNISMKILADMGRDDMAKLINGPCGFVFIKDEPVSAAKVVCDFLKENQKLVISGGFFAEKALLKEEIEALAKLPSKDVLRVQVVMGMKSPITGLVMVLNATLRKFVYCLDQVRQKKEN